MPLDEPTAFLDLPNRVEIMRVLRALTRQTGRAILLSTHDLDLALRSADRLCCCRTGAPRGRAGRPGAERALEATFKSEGIAFDRQTGTFATARGAQAAWRWPGGRDRAVDAAR